MRIYQTLEDKKNGMDNVYRVAFSEEGTAEKIEKWSISNEELTYQYTHFMTVKQGKKYYVFVATDNSDYIGFEVNEKIIEKITNMNVDKANKYIEELLDAYFADG